MCHSYKLILGYLGDLLQIAHPHSRIEADSYHLECHSFLWPMEEWRKCGEHALDLKDVFDFFCGHVTGQSKLLGPASFYGYESAVL